MKASDVRAVALRTIRSLSARLPNVDVTRAASAADVAIEHIRRSAAPWAARISGLSDRAERAFFPERSQRVSPTILWGLMAAVATGGAGLFIWASTPVAGVSSPTGRLVPISEPGVLPVPAKSPAATAVDPPPPITRGKGSDARIVASAPDLGPYRLKPPYVIFDGVTFGPETARATRLAGLVSPLATSVCFDRAGQLWACGLQARAALSRLVSNQEVECRPTGPPAEGGAVESVCKAGSIMDLGRVLVEQGFARTTTTQSSLSAVEAAAKEAGAGLWNGGWRLR